MARTVDEVLVGPGTLFTAPEGEAFPADPGTAAAGNWVDIGYSEEGWTVEADKTLEDLLVAEEVDPLGTFKTAQSIRITGQMAQNSLANLKLSFGGGTITTSDPSAGFTSYVPPVSDAFDEFAVLLRVKAPAIAGVDKPRDWQFPRIVMGGAVAIPHAKAPNKQLIAMEMRALIPTAGDIFKIIDDVT